MTLKDLLDQHPGIEYMVVSTFSLEKGDFKGTKARIELRERLPFEQEHMVGN